MLANIHPTSAYGSSSEGNIGEMRSMRTEL